MVERDVIIPAMRRPALLVLGALLAGLAGCAGVPPQVATPQPPPPVVAPPAPVPPPPKIALVLGGGAARGFAHVGVIKTLETHGIHPDMVVGTSAGAVVGALYAAGYSGFDLQKVALQLDEAAIGDWALPDRGVIRGEALQNFINRAVQNRPLEKLNFPFAVVATDLQSGERIVFRSGNTGIAVRASSSVPGVFQPVKIAGREYVDGGLVSPVPVRAARALGADIVIAVDISRKPDDAKIRDSVDMLLQTFAIMGRTLASYELTEADVVIRPATAAIGGSDFTARNIAILEGERAALAALEPIRARIAAAAHHGPPSVPARQEADAGRR